jgi:hypothetical protein
LHQVWNIGAYHEGLSCRVETNQSKGRKGKSSRGAKTRRIGIRKRIKLSTAVCRTTRNSELDLGHVQISLDQSKPLLTVQIQPENQAETFSSLINSGTTANFISPSLVEKLRLPKITLQHPHNIRMLDGSNLKTGKVWHKVDLKFYCQGLPTLVKFMVCPIGDNQVILGMPWLKEQNLNINWKEQQISL